MVEEKPVGEEGRDEGAAPPPAEGEMAAKEPAGSGLRRLKARAGDAQHGVRRALARGVRTAKNHPTASLAVIAGLGAFAAADLALAALVGIGATALVNRKKSAEGRDQAAGWLDRGRTRLAEALGKLERAIAPAGDRPAQSG